MASTSRMPPRNRLPSPSPSDAPRCNPAMSTNSAVACTTLRDALITASASTLGSGTVATPMFVSVVENGWAATVAEPPVSALNNADLPALGSPTIPNCSIAVEGSGASSRYLCAVDPVEALERITYLLDRDLAPAVKANAFMRAAETVRATDPDELRALHDEGRLKELPGIGESTGTRHRRSARRQDARPTCNGSRRPRASRSASGATSGPRSRAIATRIRSGRTAVRRSRRWPAPRKTSATTTWS